MMLVLLLASGILLLKFSDNSIANIIVVNVEGFTSHDRPSPTSDVMGTLCGVQISPDVVLLQSSKATTVLVKLYVIVKMLLLTCRYDWLERLTDALRRYSTASGLVYDCDASVADLNVIGVLSPGA